MEDGIYQRRRDQHADQRRVRGYANQLQRAAAAVALQVDALTPRDRVLVLHIALRDAVEDFAREQRATARQLA